MNKEEFQDYLEIRNEIQDLKEDLRIRVKNFSKGLGVMDRGENSDFWKGIGVLNDLIRKRGYENGISEFVRSSVSKTDRFEKVITFYNTYESIVTELYDPCFNKITGCSDDGYYDTLDSFPLHGFAMTNMALKGELEGDYNDFYLGENYVASKLFDSIVKLFGSYAHRMVDKLEMEEYTKKQEKKSESINTTNW